MKKTGIIILGQCLVANGHMDWLSIGYVHVLSHLVLDFFS